MAGSSVILVSESKHHDIQGSLKFIKVEVLCTGDDGTGAIPDTDISALCSLKLEGLYLLTVATSPGATPPTDATDLTLEVDDMDMLDGKGVNLIDATTNELTWAGSSGTDFGVPVTGAMTQKITNQSAVDALVTIIYTFAI